MIDVECIFCGAVLKAPESAIGKTGKCSKCFKQIKIFEKEPKPKLAPISAKPKQTNKKTPLSKKAKKDGSNFLKLAKAGLLLCGLGLILGAFAMDTTVPSSATIVWNGGITKRVSFDELEMLYRSGILKNAQVIVNRVYNDGLMRKQQNLLVFGSLLFISGILMIIFVPKKETKKRNEELIKKATKGKKNYCSECGNRLKDGAFFCSACGSKIN